MGKIVSIRQVGQENKNTRRGAQVQAISDSKRKDRRPNLQLSRAIKRKTRLAATHAVIRWKMKLVGKGGLLPSVVCLSFPGNL